MELLKSTLGRFRIIAFVEGISYIVLVFIAMPLKYYAGMPQAVKHVGMAHGVLFILFVIALIQVMIELRWTFLKGAIAFILSLIPFGTFYLDAKMLRKES